MAEEKGRRIATVTPDSFRDARAIGELFRDGVPVIVNLTAMEGTDAKRVVDFAAGSSSACAVRSSGCPPGCSC
ncbi:Cell division protein SepF [Streptomyces violaceorubidus]